MGNPLLKPAILLFSAASAINLLTACCIQASKPPAASAPTSSTAAPTSTTTVTGGVLRINDVVDVAIFELLVPGQTSTIKSAVDGDGNVRLMRFGTIHVAGLTPGKVEELISKAAAGPMSPPNTLGPEVRVTVEGNVPPRPIQPGDHVSVEFDELETPGILYQGDLTVDPQGNITLPNLGKVKVVGKSTASIAAAILDAIPSWAQSRRDYDPKTSLNALVLPRRPSP